LVLNKFLSGEMGKNGLISSTRCPFLKRMDFLYYQPLWFILVYIKSL
jgi:hypothetical protein